MDSNLIKISGISASGKFTSDTDISIEYIKTMIQTLPKGEEYAANFLLEKVKEIIKEIENHE